MATVKDEKLVEVSDEIANALAAKLFHSSDLDSVQEVVTRIHSALNDKRRPGQDVLVALVIMLAGCIEASPYPRDEMILAVADLLINAEIKIEPVQ